MTYQETTKNITVEVEPNYHPEHSSPEENRFFYSYNINIINNSGKTAQLLSRRWIIIDGNGEKEIVEGDGVVGEQPSLKDGENYQYSSFCPLTTPTGNMRGHFTMKSEDENEFNIKVPLFFFRRDLLKESASL